MNLRFPRIPLFLPVLILLAVLLLVFSLVEYRAAREDIEHLMDSKARLFLQTVFEGSHQAILAGQALENEMSERLLNNNRLIDRLDRGGLLTSSVLGEIARDNSIFRINVFDADGNRVLSSHGRGAGSGLGAGLGRGRRAYAEEPRDRSDIDEILRGSTDIKIIGFKKGRFGYQDRYAAAIKRTKGGAIVSVLNVEDVVHMRNTFGFGSLVQRISRAPDVVYAALQDEDGIVETGTDEITLSAIESDPFIEESLEQGVYRSRVTEWNGNEIFEAVSPFGIEGFPSGIFRIGFSLDERGMLRERMVRRLAVLSLLLLVFGIVGINGTILKNQRRELARRLESLESFTKNVLDNTREAVVVLGRDLKIRFFNRSAAQMFAVPLGKALDAPVAEVIPECADDIDSLFVPGAQAQSRDFEVEREGRRKHLTCSLSFIEREGETESVITIWNDVTDRRKMEEQLRRREQMSAMGVLASGVAHEIRNPLNAIQMIVQRLRKEFRPAGEDTAEYSSLVNAVRGETTRVNRIIEQFLQFARPAEPERKTISVRAFFDDLMPILESQAAEKKMKVIGAGFDDAVLYVDPEKIKQVFINLVRNAVDASEPGATVTVDGGKSPAGYRFTVSDTGKGIEPENLKKIFNLYYSTKPAGTGIGLSLVHQIVTQHDGSIEIDSSPGKGTTCTITLPQEAQQ